MRDGQLFTTEQASASGFGPSVMVVDDDPGCRDVLSAMLAEEGFDCRAAGDARTAIHDLQDHPADVAVVDMLMPEIDGVETIMSIRARWPRTRIIALSGGAGGVSPDYLLNLAEGLGVDAVLFKPVGLNPLVNAVRRVLDGPERSFGAIA